jgi:uncharacterized protein with PIN domain
VNPWQEDERFLCPNCGHVIELKSIDSIINTDDETYTINELIAVCTNCDRLFTAEQWHRRHGIFDPYWDVKF